MKKLYTLSLLIVSCALFAQATDSFLYSGALSSNSWGSHSGTLGQMTTLAGSLTYPGMTSQGNQTQIVAGNTEDINLPSAAPLTGVAYYSALINLPNITGLAANTTTGNYLLMFGTLSSTIPPTWTVFSGRLYIKAGTALNSFSLGVLNGSGGTAAPTFSTVDYNINTTYIVVVKFDLTTNTASLFVNPTLGTTEGTPTVTNVTGTSAAPAQINGFIIREAGTATAGTGNVQIDEVKFGSTWDSVTLSTPTTTPSASAQSFCNSATVSDLVATGATGATFSWYDVVTGGTALSSSTALATGTYYVSQTVAGIESGRTSVAVNININATTAPTATAQTFCGSKTIANLVATGTALKWYADTTSTTVLASTDAITTGTYYVSQTLNACESTRTSVAVTMNVTAPPTASAQTFCGSKTVADLVASGTALRWFATNISTPALVATTAISTGTYYVSQSLNACRSTRIPVAVTVNVTATPTASAQTFCGSKTVADLTATGTALNWYVDNTTTTVLASTDTIATGTYYVSQTLNACESTRTSVAVTVNVTAPPTASAQTFCGSKTVADLTATGTALNWYVDNTTTVLPSTDIIATGTYYVSQTLNACESTRTSVAVTVNTTATPTASAQTFCGSKTVADLTATGTALNWFANNTTTTVLASTALIATGTYYVSQTLNTCESTRTSVDVTVNVTAPPAASAQTFCGSKTVADLTATGTALNWFANNTTITVLASTAALATGTYYVSQTLATCESTRTSVAVTVNVTAPPAASAQTFCGSKTVADLTATGTALNWFANNTTTTVLASTAALATGTYFVSQTLNNCESNRTSVAVNVNVTAVPTGNTTQTFTVATLTDATVANLVVSPTNVIWYGTIVDALAGTNPLISTTVLSNGTTFYAVNVVGTCPSNPLAVTVTVTLGTANFDSLSFNYYPNPTSGILNVSYSKEISQINVVNIVGQTVLTKSTNASEVQINLSSLANATYFVKVVSDGKTKTFKVVKGL